MISGLQCWPCQSWQHVLHELHGAVLKICPRAEICIIQVSSSQNPRNLTFFYSILLSHTNNFLLIVTQLLDEAMMSTRLLTCSQLPHVSYLVSLIGVSMLFRLHSSGWLVSVLIILSNICASLTCSCYCAKTLNRSTTFIYNSCMSIRLWGRMEASS